MIDVTLRGVIRIVLLAVQRILRGARPEASAITVENRNPHAQRAEIHTGHDTHRASLSLGDN
jgi:hypothetical protein